MEPCTLYQKQPPSMDGGSWLTAVGNLLLAGGVFEGATLMLMYNYVRIYIQV